MHTFYHIFPKNASIFFVYARLRLNLPQKRLHFSPRCAMLFATLLRPLVLPLAADGLPPAKEVVHMITYTELFALGMLICAIISVVLDIIEHRNK